MADSSDTIMLFDLTARARQTISLYPGQQLRLGGIEVVTYRSHEPVNLSEDWKAFGVGGAVEISDSALLIDGSIEVSNGFEQTGPRIIIADGSEFLIPRVRAGALPLAHITLHWSYQVRATSGQPDLKAAVEFARRWKNAREPGTIIDIAG